MKNSTRPRDGLMRKVWREHPRFIGSIVIFLWSNEDLINGLAKDLRNLKADCKRRDCELLFVLFPMRFHVVNGIRGPEIVTFSQMLRDESIPTIDLFDEFVKVQKEKDLYTYRDECHPTAFGHLVSNDQLTEPIADMLLSTEKSD